MKNTRGQRSKTEEELAARREMGCWLKKHRVSLGKSREQIARFSGMAGSHTVTKIENGLMKPPSRNLTRYARAIRVHDVDLAMLVLRTHDPDLHDIIAHSSASLTELSQVSP